MEVEIAYVQEKTLLKMAYIGTISQSPKARFAFFYKIKPFTMLHPPPTFHLLEIKLAINFCFYHERCIFNLCKSFANLIINLKWLLFGIFFRRK